MSDTTRAFVRASRLYDVERREAIPIDWPLFVERRTQEVGER